MLAKLNGGADFVFGSRYVRGGTTSHDWGFLRWANSRVATLLAMPLTSVRDPMSGFFALRRATFELGKDFNPVGYKIGLELIVKCGCERVVELPIHFEDRRFGREQADAAPTDALPAAPAAALHLQVRRLDAADAVPAVGAMGTIVNLLALSVLLALAVPQRPAIALAIFGAMCFNFVLNRRFSFSQSRHRPLAAAVRGLRGRLLDRRAHQLRDDAVRGRATSPACAFRWRRSSASPSGRCSTSSPAATSSFASRTSGSGSSRVPRPLDEVPSPSSSPSTHPYPPAARYSPCGASTSRGLAPLVGPTIPSRSICSTMRAARL